MEGVERVCKESNISGLIGPIYKLIDCEEKYFTAVEIVAGKRFVCTKSLKAFFVFKKFEFGFLPLNFLLQLTLRGGGQY